MRKFYFQLDQNIELERKNNYLNYIQTLLKFTFDYVLHCLRNKMDVVFCRFITCANVGHDAGFTLQIFTMTFVRAPNQLVTEPFWFASNTEYNQFASEYGATQTCFARNCNYKSNKNVHICTYIGMHFTSFLSLI